MNAINLIKTRLAQGIAFFQRYQRSMALLSFILGVASFFLVNRQSGSAGIIAIVLLISWLWLMLENLMTQKIARRFGLELPPVILRFLTQLIHQESLFFVLPFFLVTTTWNSGQAVFTSALIIIGLVTIIDPVYYRWLAARRWLFIIFHTLALFIVLLTALPMLLRVTTEQSYIYATVATVLLAVPTLFRLMTEGRKWWGLLQTIILTGVLACMLWYGRVFVPPATLWLTDVHVTTELGDNRGSPKDAIKSLSEHQLHTQGLYAYTAIRAPRGLSEQVFHVWMQNGKEVDRIALKIQGGRAAGYRTWTHKRHFPADSVGKWKVVVVTSAGQMIGILRFQVTSKKAPQEPAKADVDVEIIDKEETTELDIMRKNLSDKLEEENSQSNSLIKNETSTGEPQKENLEEKEVKKDEVKDDESNGDSSNEGSFIKREFIKKVSEKEPVTEK